MCNAYTFLVTYNRDSKETYLMEWKFATYTWAKCRISCLRSRMVSRPNKNVHLLGYKLCHKAPHSMNKQDAIPELARRQMLFDNNDEYCRTYNNRLLEHHKIGVLLTHVPLYIRMRRRKPSFSSQSMYAFSPVHLRKVYAPNVVLDCCKLSAPSLVLHRLYDRLAFY